MKSCKRIEAIYFDRYQEYLTGKSKSVESLTILGTGCEGTLPVNCCLDLQNG